jgi:hypothetical protein
MAQKHAKDEPPAEETYADRMARRRAERQRMQTQRAEDHEQTKAENERLAADAHAPQGNGIAVVPDDETAPAASLPHGVGSAPADDPPPMSQKEAHEANRAERQREHEDQVTGDHPNPHPYTLSLTLGITPRHRHPHPHPLHPL